MWESKGIISLSSDWILTSINSKGLFRIKNQSALYTYLLQAFWAYAFVENEQVNIFNPVRWSYSKSNQIFEFNPKYLSWHLALKRADTNSNTWKIELDFYPYTQSNNELIDLLDETFLSL